MASFKARIKRKFQKNSKKNLKLNNTMKAPFRAKIG